MVSRGLFLPSTVLGFPPVAMAGLDRLIGWSVHSQMRLACQAATVVASLGIMLPLALALFPQQGTIEVSLLEREVTDRWQQNHTGRKLPEAFKYNKGL